MPKLRGGIFIAFYIIIFQITYSKVCDKDNLVQINLSKYKIPKTNSYQYSYTIHQTEALIKRNQNGTFFIGNFSTLVLKNRQNKQFVYKGVEFNFQCPALHKPTKNQQQIIELQITYQFESQQEQQQIAVNFQKRNQRQNGPYDYVIFSFPFMISQYVPQNQKPINLYINSTFQSGMSLNLSNVLKNLLSISTLVYTTKHPIYHQKNTLRLISKQLRLMSKYQFKQIKKLLEPQLQLKIQQVVNSKKNKIQNPDRIYQIKSYPFSQTKGFKRDESL